MIVSTLLTAACAALPGMASAQAPRSGGTLVVGSTQIPRHLNAAVQSGFATALPAAQLFASPLRIDDQWNPQPYLAESWKLADDGKSLTLKLRRNAVFHDGQPITSEDVAFSIMAIKANHPFTTMMGPVEKVETPDPYTAIIRLNTPHPGIVLSMMPGLCPILPKHVYGDGQDLKSHARNSANVVGSGPFKLVEFTPGRRVVMERFDKFFLSGKPHLDKVIVSISPDSTSLMMSLERGEVQMLPFISIPTDLKRLQGNPQITLTSKGYDVTGAVNRLTFNLTRKPLSDVAVRKAIATAVDKNFVAKALLGGFAIPVDGPFFPSHPFSSTDLVRYPLDLKKAGQMLDAAGYRIGNGGERFKLTIDYIPGADERQKNVAEYLRSQLKKIGITVEVRASVDFPSWAKRMATHDFDMSMDETSIWGDPAIGMHRTYLSSNIRPIVWTNNASYANPKVDELLEKAGSELDFAKRKGYYAEFQHIVTDELPLLFINTAPFHTAASKKLGNVPMSIWGPMSPYDDVYFK